MATKLPRFNRRLVCAAAHAVLAATALIEHAPIVALAELAVALAELDCVWRESV